MQTLTITTCLLYPELPPNLQPLIDRLRCRFTVEVKPWQQCGQSDLILPLCAWDYSRSPPLFRRWIAECEAQDRRLWNPPDLLRWNMDKRYLPDLQHWGVAVIPTVVLPPEEALIRHEIAKRNWLPAVIKPAIGQSGADVQKITEKRPLVELEHYACGVVLQPYIEEISENGETCLIFFGGEFSHAVRRQPAANEWRANSAFGVKVCSEKVGRDIIEQAAAVLAMLPQVPLYARVDGIVIGKRFLLSELELIEPALYLDRDPHATERFATVIEQVAQR